MKVFAVLALAGAAVAYSPCSGLNGSPVCCGTTLLGIASLNCNPPQEDLNSANDFQKICASRGNSPKCCVLGVAGQGVLCSTPVGVRE